MQSRESLSIFTPSEGRFYLKCRSFRDKAVLPLVKLLAFIRVTPVILSYISLAMAIFFFFSLVLKLSPYFAGSFLLLNLLFDGLDGSLARFLHTDSEAGNFLDHFFDYLAFLLMIFAFIFAGLVSPLFPVLYAINYLLMQGMVLFGNSTGVKLLVFSRSKLVFYLLVIFWVIFTFNFFDFFFIAGTCLLFINNIYLFYLLLRCRFT